MSPSSARSGQAEPLPALAAVLAVGLALTLYADALAAVEPEPSEPGTAGATLQVAHDVVVDDGAALPRRITDAAAAGPPGYGVNVTLTADEHRWTAGPLPPPGASDASRRTAVRIDRWTVRPGRLSVVVWS